MQAARRRFIRQVTGGVIGSWALTALPATSHARYIIARDQRIARDDEQFWKVVRDQFPLTRERVYFNNGTMGPSPYPVLDLVKRSLEDVDTSGEYGGWDTVRGKLAAFVNVQESEISLTHNVTEGINVVAWGLPLKRGDEVILTDHEHPGNRIPWASRYQIPPRPSALPTAMPTAPSHMPFSRKMPSTTAKLPPTVNV